MSARLLSLQWPHGDPGGLLVWSVRPPFAPASVWCLPDTYPESRGYTLPWPPAPVRDMGRPVDREYRGETVTLCLPEATVSPCYRLRTMPRPSPGETVWVDVNGTGPWEAILYHGVEPPPRPREVFITWSNDEAGTEAGQVAFEALFRRLAPLGTADLYCYPDYPPDPAGPLDACPL